MKSLSLVPLILVALTSSAFATSAIDACVSSPETTFNRIVSENKVDIGDLSGMESDLRTIAANIDSTVSDEEKTSLRKLARRNRLAIELHTGAARGALAAVRGLSGEAVYSKYVNLLTGAMSLYGKVFAISEKYFAGQASGDEVKAVMTDLAANAQTLAAGSQGVAQELKRLEPSALGKIAQAHSKASLIKRCQLARTMFER